jgi:hypothetical protein
VRTGNSCVRARVPRAEAGRVAAAIGCALPLAAGHRNLILGAIVLQGPDDIAYLAGAGPLGLPEFLTFLGMFSRMRARPQIN